MLDYTFGNTKLKDRVVLLAIESLILRCILDLRDSVAEVVITPLYLNYPLYSELEI